MAVKRPSFAPVSAEDLRLFNPFTPAEPDPDAAGPFRIGELSRLSGIPVGTIKYYLRESLVPPGKATAKTQALYGAEHLRRLRLIRVLVEVGGLSIAQVRGIAAMLDGGSPDDGPGLLDRTVSYAVEAERAGPGADSAVDDHEVQAARAATDAFVDEAGFTVDRDSPARAELGNALHALRTLGIADDPVVFSEHARLAYELAAFETATIAPLTDPTELTEAITVGSVVFGAAFMALRQMGHEHETRLRLGIDDDCANEPVGEAGGTATAAP